MRRVACLVEQRRWVWVLVTPSVGAVDSASAPIRPDRPEVPGTRYPATGETSKPRGTGAEDRKIRLQNQCCQKDRSQ